MTSPNQETNRNPIREMEEWEDFTKERYPEPSSESPQGSKTKEEFRNYEADARSTVRDFYRQNHRFQTVDFVQSKKRRYLAFQQHEMGIWEAAEYLNTLVDDSDPDTDLSQLQHLLQTSEQIRKDGKPRWYVLTGFIHDLGKVLCLFGEPQWAVVGDTFPVGCAWSDRIVFHEFFADNPDREIPEYQSRLGVYTEGCGLDAVDLSWGHDEYIYQIAKPYLPTEALYMLRYHSFYPWHREGAYDFLCNEEDRRMLPWVQDFNQYDLYTKSHTTPDVAALKPYYEDLIAEFFPDKIKW